MARTLVVKDVIVMVHLTPRVSVLLSYLDLSGSALLIKYRNRIVVNIVYELKLDYKHM